MVRSHAGVFASAALVLLVSLAACGRQHDKVADPALPNWAGEVMGKTLGVQFVIAGQCKGFADGVDARRVGASPAVALHGWGWSEDAHAPVRRVVFADAAGRIVGVGSGGWGRPDVPKAVPEVTTPDVGWIGVAESSGGKLTVAAIGADRKACVLGAISVPAAG